MSKVSFTAAMKKYFGLRTEGNITEFAQELKALSYDEKMEFHRMLTEDAKVPCEPPMKPAEVVHPMTLPSKK